MASLGHNLLQVLSFLVFQEVMAEFEREDSYTNHRPESKDDWSELLTSRTFESVRTADSGPNSINPHIEAQLTRLHPSAPVASSELLYLPLAGIPQAQQDVFAPTR